jgi:hypothetical protein
MVEGPSRGGRTLPVRRTMAHRYTLGAMKKYHITLTIGVSTYLDAEAWKQRDSVIYFMKRGQIVAWYASATVRKIEDCTHGPPCEPEYQAAA